MVLCRIAVERSLDLPVETPATLFIRHFDEYRGLLTLEHAGVHCAQLFHGDGGEELAVVPSGQFRRGASEQLQGWPVAVEITRPQILDVNTRWHPIQRFAEPACLLQCVSQFHLGLLPLSNILAEDRNALGAG